MRSEPPHTGSAIRGPLALTALSALSTALSCLLSINEYVRVFGDEMAGSYDCDGPGVVLALAVGGIVSGLLAIVWWTAALRRNRTRGALAAFGVAVIILIVASARAAPAILELRKNAAPQSPCH